MKRIILSLASLAITTMAAAQVAEQCQHQCQAGQHQCQAGHQQQCKAGHQCQTQSPLQWTMARTWANGLDALPDMCTNLTEFRSQYLKNSAQWNAAFKWLAENDLAGMKAGSYPIGDSGLSANVQDGTNQPLEKGGSESHRKKIDLQYVVSGREGFALLDHASSTPNCEYKPDVIHYDYDREKTFYITSSPQRFFLFFPSDWHIAWLKTPGATDKARVVVIKIDYIE